MAAPHGAACGGDANLASSSILAQSRGLNARMAHRADTFWSILLFLVLSAPSARAQNPVSLDNDASALLSQNQRLEAELQQQQKMIEALNARLSDLAKASAEQQQTLQTLQGGDSSPISAPARESQSAHEIRISGEAALAFFSHRARGTISQFRISGR